ncbi:nucleotidyltransferase domain-containing protein [Aestuariimicrobium ganziense]|uniref:nucleotidyltransferase domain-containing protein n=1 Tax=Aestuariimicrobium ganziense TaxID=2773677 RepID=UPI001942E6AF|nr:lincomycin resistance protein LmrB [Aestuariimicrobium ganziense]
MEYTEATPASEVVALVDHLEANEVTYQINGGWGVDALVGQQTRPHLDIDLYLDGLHFDALIEWLESRGYQLEGDYMPVAQTMTRINHDDRVVHRVDVHPMVLDDEGSGYQSVEKEGYFHHPVGDRTVGTVEGRNVVVGSIEHQEHLHKGYLPRDVDLHDLMELEKLKRPTITPIELPKL